MIGIEPMAWALGGLVVGATAMRWFVRHRLARFCDALGNGADVSSSAGCEAVIADLVRARDRSVEAVRREQGLARRVAEEQASRLRRALGGLEDPVLVLDPGGGVTECNEAAIELGAPQYNEGDIAGCARTYTQAAEAIVQRCDDGATVGALQGVLRKTADMRDANEVAWAFRRVFDTLLDRSTDPRLR